MKRKRIADVLSGIGIPNEIMDEAVEKVLKNMKFQLPLVPCSCLCSKCGSDNINRMYHKGGEEWNRDHFERDEKEDDFVVYSRRKCVAKRECISHRCRCCRYEWNTDVLNGEK